MDQAPLPQVSWQLPLLSSVAPTSCLPQHQCCRLAPLRALTCQVPADCWPWAHPAEPLQRSYQLCLP